MSVQHVYKEGLRYHVTPIGLLPGVTSVLSATQPAYKTKILNGWKTRIGESEAELIIKKACERGNYIHKVIENRFLRLESFSSIKVEYQTLIESLESTLDSISKVFYIEKPTYHTLGFAGSPDLVGEFKGRVTVIDWKTSSKPKYKSQIGDYILQVAAYVQSANQTFNLDIDQALIAVAIEGKKEAKQFLIEKDELLEAWNEFQQRFYQFYNKYPGDGF